MLRTRVLSSNEENEKVPISTSLPPNKRITRRNVIERNSCDLLRDFPFLFEKKIYIFNTELKKKKETFNSSVTKRLFRASTKKGKYRARKEMNEIMFVNISAVPLRQAESPPPVQRTSDCRYLLFCFFSEPCEKTYCAWGATCVVSESGKPLCLCPTNCPSNSAQVCGSDDVTYTNQCHLRQASCQRRKNTRVKHEGACGE